MRDAMFDVKNSLIATFGKSAASGSGRILNYHFGLMPLKMRSESAAAAPTGA